MEGMMSNDLSDLLWRRAEDQGDRPFLHFVSETGPDMALSLRETTARASRIAGGLRAAGVGPGDRVGVLCPNERDFVLALFAILRAGAVAVPLTPPVFKGERTRFLRRFGRIVTSSRPAALIVDPDLFGLMTNIDAVADLPELLVMDYLDGPDPAVHGAGDDVAILQYTSGSTGHPKGVTLTHHNVMRHIVDIGRALQLDESQRAVTWLPLFHDMGLIGMLLSMIAAGTPIWLMSPQQFMFRPALWLQTITAARGTITTAPNFGYQFCAERVDDDELRGLDLSTLRLALNGAEPVRPQTLDAFSKRFAPVGFAREAFLPVYGLAEATLAVSFPELRRGPLVRYIDRDTLASEGIAERCDEGLGKPTVALGRPFPDHEIRIADEDGNACEDRVQGEVQVRGPSICKGYFNDPDATRDLFDGDWMRTGDLAFIDDGDLFVTGRVKDVLIRAGKKYHAVDLERATEGVEGIRKGNAAAFAIEAKDGQERVVLLVEVAKGTAMSIELEHELEEAVARQEGIRPDRVVLAPAGTLLKTPSGKVRRAAVRDMWLRDTKKD